MNVINSTDLLHPGLRSVLLNGPAAFSSDKVTGDDMRLLAQAVQHLTWRLASAERAVAETHDRCACCGGWINKKAKAVRVRIHTEQSTPEDVRVLAYHGACLEEQDPEQVEGMILQDAERMGGDEWVPAAGGQRLPAIRAALLRGLEKRQGSESLYQMVLDLATHAGHLPKEWLR